LELEVFYVPGISHFSYMVLTARGALVIDPKRDIETYLSKAALWKTSITHVLLTHNHADFVGGHLLLAETTKAKLIMGRGAGVSYPVEEVSEGDRIEMGNVEIKVMESPGHTPEHVSYLLVDRLSSHDPMAVFTGDSLLSGDVGRPDLFGPEKQEELTQKLFNTLEKYRSLSEGLMVYPAHGAGSLCGKRIGQRNPTTIGFEKKANPLLHITNHEDFKKELLRNMPTPPPYYFTVSKRNKTGEGLDIPFHPSKALKISELEGEILDLRDQAAFAVHHIPDSLNTVADTHFPTLTGYCVSPESPVSLVGDDQAVAYAHSTMYRMGYDNIVGHLPGGIDIWRERGRPCDSFAYLRSVEVQELLESNQAQMLDVRNENEWEEGYVPRALHIPLAHLTKGLKTLNKESFIIAACGHGCRGSLAASILEREGFPRVGNMAGGLLAWKACGLPVTKDR
jgi:glyoxylase-like metal-dependent hydrolase (beta-lactamase superfamily II)/rhodanese-related sulfurtransferase